MLSNSSKIAKNSPLKSHDPTPQTTRGSACAALFFVCALESCARVALL